MIAFDGQRRWEEISFSVTNDKLETVSGMIGIADAHEGQTLDELEIAKSERAAKAIQKERLLFSILGVRS